MRYWYLKGGDVLGPLSAQEIAQDSDFSAEVLVCPEPNSGDETFWKIPSMYAEDFAPFIKEEPVVKAKPVVKDVPTAAARPAVSVQAPVVAQPVAVAKPAVIAEHKEPLESAEYAALAAVSPEETIHTQSPLNAPLENNLLEELPAKAVLATEEPKAEVKETVKEEPKAEVKEEPKAEIKKTEEKPHPADPLIAVIENQKPLQSFREEDFTLVSPVKSAAKPAQTTAKESDKEGTIFRQKQEHAAPVILKSAPVVALQKAKPAPIAKQEPAAEMPTENPVKTPLPVETFGAGSGVVHIKQDGEEVPTPEEALKNKASSKEKSFFSSMAEEKPVNHSAEEADAPFPFGGEMKTAEVSELIKEEPSSPFLQVKEQKPRAAVQAEQEEEPLIPSSAGDRVAGGIMPTTNGKIISSSDGRLEDKKPKNDVIYLLVISMFLFTGIALFMTFFGNKKEDKKPALPAAQTQKEEQTAKPVLQGLEEGVASPEAQQPAAPVKTADIAHENGAIVQQDAEQGKAKAQEIVKKYLLDESRGTIADFLNKNYGGGMYQTAWSSSPLYADTYVVDFTASKVRAEPIVYLFRVDIKKGVVTGGLNGITMDLLAVK